MNNAVKDHYTFDFLELSDAHEERELETALIANYSEVPQNLTHAIVEANTTRKDFIAASIIKKLQHKPPLPPGEGGGGGKAEGLKSPIVGIHRLVMKAGSDNFRSSTFYPLSRRRDNQRLGCGHLQSSRMASCFIQRARVRGLFMKRIKAKSIEVIVHEPALKEPEFFHSRVVNDSAQFKQ